MNEPHGSADAAARGWRSEILREFTPGVTRLTVVDDPDGLLGEPGIVEALRARGFEVVSLNDRIAFRFFYESRYRSRRDRGAVADVVAVLTTGEAHERAVPYDVWRAGRRLSLSLGALFPKLSWPVVNALDRSDLDALHAAQTQEPPAEPLGESATRKFVLRHVFGIAPETIRQASDLLDTLLRLHYRRRRLPRDLERHLVEALQRKPAFGPWPLARLIPDRDAFFAFLQERWPIFLDRLTAGADAVRETPPAYARAFSGPAELPFDHPDVRVYVDNLFLEGTLRPVAHPRGREVAEPWARAGVAIDPRADRRRRLDGLLKSVEASLPGDGARHYDWLDFAPRWAQVNALVFDPDADPAGEDARARHARIRDRIDERFTAWLRRRFEALHNLPPSMPVMIHHVPRALARHVHESADGKVALVVMDGLAFDQWVAVRAALAEQRPGLRFREDSLFAWIPTLTTVSRQACFTGRLPRYFPASIDSTAREPAAWRRFWGDEGLDAARVVYAKNLREPSDVETVAELVSRPRVRVAGLVVDAVDRIMHGMKLGSAGMHNQVRQWTRGGALVRLLDILFDRGFEVFLTSDHGNVETTGCGAPREGSVADLPGRRVRVFSDPALRARVAKRFPGALAWPATGLPEDYLALLAPARRSFVRESERPVAHGGVTLEEVVVPFVAIERSGLTSVAASAGPQDAAPPAPRRGAQAGPVSASRSAESTGGAVEREQPAARPSGRIAEPVAPPASVVPVSARGRPVAVDAPAGPENAAPAVEDGRT